jgi:hypothetical protein
MTLMPSKLTLAILFSASLAGCQSSNTTSLTAAQKDCETYSYVVTWNCIKSRAGVGANEDYIARGDALAAQVKAGRITDVQAKAELMKP